MYRELDEEAMLRLGNRTYPKKGFIKRAETRFNNGFKASATMDIPRAASYAKIFIKHGVNCCKCRENY